MKAFLGCMVSFWLVVSTLAAEPITLPDYAPRKMHVLISRQVPGLEGTDYIGDFVQYSITGQNLLDAKIVLPCEKQDLQIYLSQAQEATIKGFENPDAAVMAFAAVTKFGTPAEKVAMYLPDSIKEPKVILDLFTKQATRLREITSIQPLLVLEINGVINVYFKLQMPRSRPIGGSMAMRKNGNAYFPIFDNPESSLENDVINTFAFEVKSHYLPLYIIGGTKE